ncbi:MULTISPECIES: flavin reductase [unclassified Arthrobacter]|uniref:flavin reductase n=1 Tax=unclassified Arthrobacter TaxID=235627 RepID=UPI001C8445CD|nr:flavin reductase [Arthrobacter sp. MAHUQ-56]MBX7444619.1 flavin reductase [Arthrobacter sp. MAHUQ-56]
MTAGVDKPETQTQAGALPPLTGEEFRFVVGHLPSGVTVVTTQDTEGRHGMTASSVTSLSLEPPMILACLNRSAPTTSVVAETGRFAVNILGAGQGDLALQFARPSEDKFAGVSLAESFDDIPVLSDSLAYIVCDVAETVQAGTHTVFLGRVQAASASPGMPLAYYRGGFGKFQQERDEHALEWVRSRIIRGEYLAGKSLTAEDLARESGLDHAACYFALTRMLSDGLMSRGEQDSFIVEPFSATAADMTFDARCALELAALELGAETISDDQIAALQSNWDEMSRFLIANTFVDFERYLDANNAFHSGVVSLAANARVMAAYAGLQVRAAMQRSFGSTAESSERFLSIQARLLDALGRRDLAGARQATRDYNVAAKARAREVLESLHIPHV